MNVVNWFEIPVNDMNRAIRFYNLVFGYELESMDLGSLEMAMFPATSGDSGSKGSLIYSPDYYEPSTKGTLVYFAISDIDKALSNVVEAGGKILMGKTLISEEYGYRGLMIDSEGNRIALHARS